MFTYSKYLFIKPTHLPLLQITRLIPRPNPKIPPPLPHPSINFFFGHSFSDQTKRNPQLRLHIPVARLIIKEQYLIIRYIARLMNPREMLRFVPREDLDVIKVVQGAHGAASCVLRSGVVGEGWYYV